MSEPTATDSGPTAPKRRGRPPKAERDATAKSALPSRSRLANQVEKLKEQLAAWKAASPDVASPERAAAVPLTTGARPGEYIVVGKDKLGQEEIRKKGWTRGDIERVYPKVTFTPRFALEVTISGQTWKLAAEREITVPSAVKDKYDESIRIQHPDLASLYPEPSMDAIQRINQTARATGQKVWSRMHYLGAGEVIPEVETPKQ